MHRTKDKETNERKDERIHDQGTIHGCTAHRSDAEYTILGKQRPNQSMYKALVLRNAGSGQETFRGRKHIAYKAIQVKEVE